MNKHVVTVLFLLLALALYYAGMALPATIFLVMGGLAELVFWVRVFNQGGHNTDN